MTHCFATDSVEWLGGNVRTHPRTKHGMEEGKFAPMLDTVAGTTSDPVRQRPVFDEYQLGLHTMSLTTYCNFAVSKVGSLPQESNDVGYQIAQLSTSAVSRLRLMKQNVLLKHAVE